MLAACGTTQALSGPSESGPKSVIVDPDNPYWTGNHASGGVASGGARTPVVQDADNPYWSNPYTMPVPVSDPATDRLLRGPR